MVGHVAHSITGLGGPSQHSSQKSTNDQTHQNQQDMITKSTQHVNRCVPTLQPELIHVSHRHMPKAEEHFFINPFYLVILSTENLWDPFKHSTSHSYEDMDKHYDIHRASKIPRSFLS